MNDPIQSYRQPMVTAIGIILGFVLGFAADWATEAQTETLLSDILIVIALAIGSVCLLVALYRMLNMNYPKEESILYYQKTLRIFLLGLSISIIGVMVSLILFLI